jgi:hypothetical protein
VIKRQWGKLHNEEPNDLYCSPNIILVIKSRRMRRSEVSEGGLTVRGVDDFVGTYMGHTVAQLLEALRYKPEGRGIDSRWCHWNFSFT